MLETIAVKIPGKAKFFFGLVLIYAAPGSAQDAATPKNESVNVLEPGEALLLPVWLRQLGGTVILEADSVDFESLQLTNVKLPITLTSDGIELADGRVTSGVGELGINASYDFSSDDILIRVIGESLSFDDPDKQISPGEMIFNNEELLPYWLRTVHGRLTLEVDLVVVDEMAFRGVKGPIVFTDQGFEVDVVATVGAGSIVINIDHDYSGVETSIKAKGSGISLGVMRLTRDYIEGAPTNFELDVVGEGTTERAFVSTMDGFIEAEVGPGKTSATSVPNRPRSRLLRGSMTFRIRNAS